MTENWQRAGFGLYFHWPFCQVKCPYCDFNSHVWDGVDQNRWTEAFLQEIERSAKATSDRVVSTIFFGGGTPSLMEAETVARILKKVQDTWTCANDLEITLEANPTSIEAERFAGYRDAGVNRVSIGVQSLINEDLRRLGRLHTVEEALNALEIARDTFDRVSFDMIYARQDQSLENWQNELKQCLNLGPDHLSLYQLTIEDGTAFGALYDRGKLRGLPSDELGAEMFEVTQHMTEEAGLPAYEISNHAVPGNEARHNQIYWNGGDWAGIGPGAHGRVTIGCQRIATTTPSSPGLWMKQAEDSGAISSEPLSPYDAAVEYLMMSTRTVDGCDLAHLSDLSETVCANTVTRATEGDLPIRIDENRLYITKEGRLLLNAILGQLLRDSA